MKNSVNSFLNHIDDDAQLITDADRKRNVLGISTTNLNDEIPSRKSTSERALTFALDYAKIELGSNILMIKLRDLSFNYFLKFPLYSTSQSVTSADLLDILLNRS